jgi:hypothetical protein
MQRSFQSRLIKIFIILSIVLAVIIGTTAPLPANATQTGEDSVNPSKWGNFWSFNVPDASPVFLPIILNYGPGSWIVINYEDFEGNFPGIDWVLGDDTNGAYKWAKRSCRPFEGGYSAWAVGGGSGGSGLSCGTKYPSEVIIWMDYGPFSLADATAAEMQFKFWANTEPVDFDLFCWGASIDYSNWDIVCFSGETAGWLDQVFDLSDYLGESQVWITFEFESDSNNEFPEGVYVDNMEIRKCTASSCSSSGSVSDFLSNDDLVTFHRSSKR